MYIIYRLLFSFFLTSLKEITEYRCYLILVPPLSSIPYTKFFFNVIIFYLYKPVLGIVVIVDALAPKRSVFES
jgi:hypothetical protein